ncbi:protein kinase [Myxococcota bacterium]|nr:protein kinase [Myxococcota bacterium]
MGDAGESAADAVSAAGEPDSLTASPGTDGPGDPTASGDVDSFLRQLARAPPVEIAGQVDRPLGPGDVVAGRFEVIRALGRGGMATVHLARDLALGRSVAVKAVDVPPEGGPRRERWLAQFQEEARATARLNHPHIVTLYEAGQWGSRPFIVLELLTGETLATRLRRGRLTVRESLETGSQIAAGLAHAHGRGILHRDLKPQNVWICEDGTVKVMDFGLAHVERLDPGQIESMFTGTGPRMEFEARGSPTAGTPAYMAPEQWAGEAQDPRTDVFGLGATLYEMLAGRPPFAGRDRDGLRRSAAGQGPAPSIRDSVPDLPERAAGIVDACLARERSARPGADEVSRALRALVRPGTPGARGDENPYRFLHAFGEEEASLFFGREREVGRLRHLLRHHPRLAVVGPSGAGKTSLVMAGLVPRLREEAPPWDVVGVRPGPDPLASLQRALAGLPGAPSDRDLADAPGLAGSTLRSRATATGRPVLVVVDPFEELFTRCVDRRDRRAFTAALRGAADDSAGAVRLVLLVREDFLSRLAEAGDLLGDDGGAIFPLSAPGERALREAIELPALAVGHSVEPGLVEDLLGPLSAHPAPLPLLQFAAGQLFERRDPVARRLTRGALQDLGGVAGILATHGDEVLRALPGEADRDVARRLLTALVTPEGTRRLLGRDALVGEPPDGPSARVLRRLIDGRLLTSVAGGGVELAHESLVTGWTTLAGWLAEDREGLLVVRRAEDAARHWDERGRPPGLLWQGPALDEAARHLPRAGQGAGPVLAAYLAAGRSREGRARRLRRGLLAALVGGAVAVAGGSVLAARIYRAKEAEAVAQAARAAEAGAEAQAQALALEADQAASTDNTRSLRLAVRAVESRAGTAQTDALRRALQLPYVEAVYLGHSDLLKDADLAPDGHTVATASWDGTARIWDAGGRLRSVLRHDGPVETVSFSPAGDRVLTSSWDGTAGLWTLAGERLARLGEREGRLHGARFSPSGDAVLTWSSDGTARLYAANGRRVATLGGEGGVFGAAFSPRGDVVATAHGDGRVRIWDRSGALLRTLAGHPRAAETVLFSPDGSVLATTGWGDNVARLWDLPSGRLRARLEGHVRRVSRAVFHPSGEALVTLSYDRTARIWGLDGSPRNVLAGHTGRVVDAGFSADGHLLFTVDDDGAGFVWTLDGRKRGALRGHTGWVTRVKVAPDGHRVLTAGQDGTARLWALDDALTAWLADTRAKAKGGRVSARDPREVVRGADAEARPLALEGTPDLTFLPAPHRWVSHLGVSPDGTAAVTVSGDREARIWDLARPAPPAVLRGHAGWVTRAAWSPGGESVLTASDDGTAAIWDRAGRRRAVVVGHDGPVRAVAFSPDGALVATGGADGTVRVTDVAGATRSVDRGHSGPVTAVAFSPDGARLATASQDGSGRIWGVDGVPRAVLGGHTSAVLSVAWDDAGDRVLTLDGDSARTFTAGGRPLGTFGDPDAHVVLAAFVPGTPRVVTADNRGQVRIRDGSGFDRVLPGHADRVTVLRFSPDGRRLVTGSGDGTARVWTADGAPVGVLGGHGGFVLEARFSGDGSRVATGSWDGLARVFEAGGTLLATLPGHDAPVTAVAFGPGDDTLWSWSRDAAVQRHENAPERLLARARQRLAAVPPGPHGLRIGMGWDFEAPTGPTARPPAQTRGAAPVAGSAVLPTGPMAESAPEQGKDGPQGR